MIRNLKALLAAVLALAVAAAVTGVEAQAAEFHCSVTNCRYRMSPDGTGKTAHHVWLVENSDTTQQLSFTCGELKGEGTTAATTATKVTLENLEYPKASCSVNGTSGVEIVMNGCKFEFSSSGTVSIVGCNTGKSIEVQISGGCIFFTPAQGPLTGIGYHSVGTSPSREVTVETNVHGLKVTTNGACGAFITGTEPFEGTYTTGNTIVTGETQAGAMADAWFL